jgi:hypothetical protein
LFVQPHAIKTKFTFPPSLALKEAHPVRLKKIYIVHTAWFVNQAFAIVKPFIKTELMSLLHFTTGGPDEIFPLEILPEVRSKAAAINGS